MYFQERNVLLCYKGLCYAGGNLMTEHSYCRVSSEMQQHLLSSVDTLAMIHNSPRV